MTPISVPSNDITESTDWSVSIDFTKTLSFVEIGKYHNHNVGGEWLADTGLIATESDNPDYGRSLGFTLELPDALYDSIRIEIYVSHYVSVYYINFTDSVDYDNGNSEIDFNHHDMGISLTFKPGKLSIICPTDNVVSITALHIAGHGHNPFSEDNANNYVISQDVKNAFNTFLQVISNPELLKTTTYINSFAELLTGKELIPGTSLQDLLKVLLDSIKGSGTDSNGNPVEVISADAQASIIQSGVNLEIIAEFFKAILEGNTLQAIQLIPNLVNDVLNQLLLALKPLDSIGTDFTNSSKLIIKGFTDVAKYIRDNSIGDNKRWSTYIKEQITKAETISDKLSRGTYTSYDGFKYDFDKLLGFKGITDSILNLTSFIPVLLTFVQSGTKPIERTLDYLTNSRYPNVELDIPDIIQNYFKGNIAYKSLIDKMAKYGYSEENTILILNNAVKVPDISLLQQMKYRGLIKDIQIKEALQAQGYDANTIAGITELFNLIPSISDLITFQVKEVFSPDIAQKFGQLQDLPQDIYKYTRQQGLSDFWTNAYWAAHWELPSIGQGFEMLQRGIIDYDTLVLLLKANDVMPFWRDKLIQMAYNPLTRVDIKRMFQIGVLNEQQTFKSYKDIGYNDENARNLLEYTKRSIVHSDDIDVDKLTKRAITAIENSYTGNKITTDEYVNLMMQLGIAYSDIYASLAVLTIEKEIKLHPDRTLDNKKRIEKLVTDGMIKGTIDEHEAHQALISLGYTDIEANQEIAYLVTEHNTKIHEQIAEQLKQSYINRVIDETTVITQLNNEGFTLYEQNKLVSEWNLLREYRFKKLDEKTIKTLYEQGIITGSEFAEELRGLGYAEKYVNWIVQMENIKLEG